MISSLRCLLLLAIGGWAAHPAPGALTWKKTHVEVPAKLGQTHLKAVYEFTNTGSSIVEIRNLTPGCGCTTATASERRIAPGKSGSIAITFEIGHRTGRQLQTVVVETNDAQLTPTVLMLGTTIPETAKLSPAFVHWVVNEKNAPRIVQGRIADGTKLRPVSVSCDNPVFQTTLRATKDPLEFEIVVIPSATTAETQGIITVVLTGEDGIKIRSQSHALVRP